MSWQLPILFCCVALLNIVSGLPASQPLPVGQTVEVNALQLIEYSESMFRQQRTYSISGLPRGTGLALDPITGVVYGVPNEIDLAAEPIKVTIYVDDVNGHKSVGTFDLVVSECSVNKDCGSWGFCVGGPKGKCHAFSSLGGLCGTAITKCNPNLHCVNNKCCECLSDAHCPTGFFCGASNYCFAWVTIGGLCGGTAGKCAPGLFCASVQGQSICSQCSQDSHCSAGHFCREGACLTYTVFGGSCSSSSSSATAVGAPLVTAAGAAPPCRPPLRCINNQCIECATDLHCGSTGYCSTAGRCIAFIAVGQPCGVGVVGRCGGSLQCFNSRCSECNTASPCAKGKFCFQGVCLVYALIGGPCAANSKNVCDPSNYCVNARCQECRQSPDCPFNKYCKEGTCIAYTGFGGACGGTSGGVCKLASFCVNSVCRECVTNSHCGKDHYCSSAGQCIKFVVVGGKCGRLLGQCRTQNYCISGVCKQCDSDRHCPASHYCSTQGACLVRVTVGGACSGTVVCGAGLFCINGACRACSMNSHCPAGFFCTGAGACQAFVAVGAKCSVLSGPQGLCPTGYHCVNGLCRQCGMTSHCLPGYFCNGAGQCVGYLLFGTACPTPSSSSLPPSSSCGPGLSCFGGQCLECRAHSDCGATGFQCQTGRCVRQALFGQTCSLVGNACAPGLQCLTLAPNGAVAGAVTTALPSTATCVECQASSQCGPGRYCAAGRCLTFSLVGEQCGGTTGYRCGAGLQCINGVLQTAFGVCRQCNVHSDCSALGLGHYCSSVGKCLVYSTLGQPCGGAWKADCAGNLYCASIGSVQVCSVCSADSHCGVAGFCYLGSCVSFTMPGEVCQASDRCLPGFKCVAGVCLQCSSDADCGAGQFCSTAPFLTLQANANAGKCSSGVGQCVGFAVFGGGCMGPSQFRCAAGLVCVGGSVSVTGTCRECISSPASVSVQTNTQTGVQVVTTCPAGSSCTATGRCSQTVTVVGQPCSSYMVCQGALFCSNGVCSECSANSDCKGAHYCYKGRCYPYALFGGTCSQNIPCMSGLPCVNVSSLGLVCRECAVDGDCRPGYYCSHQGRCHAYATINTGCGGPGRTRCLPPAKCFGVAGAATGQCLECSRDSDCSTGLPGQSRRCNTAKGTCETLVTVGQPCGPGGAGLCSTGLQCVLAYCVECTANSECGPAQYCSGGRCFNFKFWGQTCGSVGLVCGADLVCVNGQCRQCGRNGDCSQGHYCANGRCVPYLVVGKPCGTGIGICDPSLDCVKGNLLSFVCKAGPLVLVLPSGRAIVGKQFFYFLCSSFAKNGNLAGPLAFKLSGLPVGSGLSLAPEGIIQGLPNRVDLTAASLSLKIEAVDGYGNKAIAVVEISVEDIPDYLSLPSVLAIKNTPFQYDTSQFFDKKLASTSQLIVDNICQGQTTFLNQVPIAGPTPPLPSTPYVSILPPAALRGPFVQLFYYSVNLECDFTQFFSAYTGQYMLQFRITGFPAGSGFSHNGLGLVQGTPNSIDCMASPLSLQVTAFDSVSFSQTYSFVFRVDGCSNMVVTPPTPPVAAPSPTPAPTPPSSLTPAYGPAFKPLVPVWGVVGQPFKLALSQYFRGAQGEQTYFLAGLPVGSGLTLNAKTGDVEGSPSPADALAPQPLVLQVSSVDAIGNAARGSVYVHFMLPTQPGMQAAPSIPLPGHNANNANNANNVNNVNGPQILSSLAMPSTMSQSQVSFTGESEPRASQQTASRSLCSHFGWDPALYGEPSVCGGSQLFGSRCLLAASFEEAEQSCSNIGARLCSAKELRNDEARGSGCGMDTKRVWSSTPCALGSSKLGMMQTLPGASTSLEDVPSVCSYRLERHAVLCCADESSSSSAVEGVYRTVFAQQQQQQQQAITAPLDLGLVVAIADGRYLFEYDARQAFVFAPTAQSRNVSASVRFYLLGLPKGTGFVIDEVSGIIRGVASQADLQAVSTPLGTRPITVTVIADAGRQASARTKLYLALQKGNVNSPPVVVTSATSSASSHGKLQLQATQGEVAVFDFESHFSDPDKDQKLLFSVLGLPSWSGLQMDPVTGILAGTLTRNAAGDSFELVVVASDGHGGQASLPVHLSVFPASQKKSNSAPVSAAVPPVYTQQGKAVLVNLRSFFADPDKDELVFGCSGLPAGTGLSLTQAGLLHGVPSAADAAGNADGGNANGGNANGALLLITVTAADPDQAAVKETVAVFVAPVAAAAGAGGVNLPPRVRGGVRFATARTARFFLLEGADLFTDPEGDALTYSAAGLPAKTGFTVDPDTGEMFGSPTSSDVEAAEEAPGRVLTVAITARDGQGGVAGQLVRLQIDGSVSALLAGSNTRLSGSRGGASSARGVSGFSNRGADPAASASAAAAAAASVGGESGYGQPNRAAAAVTSGLGFTGVCLFSLLFCGGGAALYRFKGGLERLGGGAGRSTGRRRSEYDPIDPL